MLNLSSARDGLSYVLLGYLTTGEKVVSELGGRVAPYGTHVAIDWLDKLLNRESLFFMCLTAHRCQTASQAAFWGRS